MISSGKNLELAVYSQGDLVYFVLLEDDKPVELIIDQPGKDIHRQDIYLGLVRKVVPALACAFVDIGTVHDALLPIAQAPPDIKTGRPLIVQIMKEAAAGKGHALTTRIQLPGPFAVLKTQGPNRRRSKLLAFSADEQERLFEKDLTSLRQTWAHLVAESGSGDVPRLLLACGNPMSTALRSFVSPSLRRIRVEGNDLFQDIYQEMKQLMPSFLPLLELYVPPSDYGLAAALSLGDLPESLSRRKVWLENGGYIVVDRTEAMTVIDVNSGKDTRIKEDGDLRLRTNLLAAREIARQLRLRNLGGIVVIDFINLTSEEDKTAVQSALQEALEADRASSRLLGFTALGLFEMTRTAL